MSALPLGVNRIKIQRGLTTSAVAVFVPVSYTHLCGECGKSLTIRYTNDKHPKQIYSCKTYNAYGKQHCTQHLSLIHI